MRYRADLSGDARRDLEAIDLWLTQDGAGVRARRKLGEIEAALRDLRQSPQRWPIGLHTEVRERPVAQGYRLMYRILTEKPGTVLVIRVFGPFQDRSDL